MATKLRQKHNKWLKKILKHKKFGIVLNLGCGRDKDSEGHSYKSYINCKKMIRVDPDPKFKKKVDFNAKGEDIPLGDASIDLVFMNWSFYITDMPIVLSEICRVLRKDGKVLISYADHNYDKIVARKKVADIRSLLESRIIIKKVFENEAYGIPGGFFQKAEAIYGVLK